MQNNTLQMKRALRTALLVLLLSVVGMDEGYAQTLMYTFDFSEVCSTGQTLYYKITDEANHHVELVAPGYYYHFDENGGWNGLSTLWKNYQRPVGDLVIPSQVRGYYVVGTSWNCGTVYFGNENQTETGSGPFSYCTGLTSVVLPNTMTSIGSLAFNHCTGLTSIDIPNSVFSIGGGAFSNCSNLSSIVISNSATHIGSYREDYVINGHAYYGNTFSGCTSLASIDIPNSVTFIGESTFSGCSNLTSITIPSSVDTIRDLAFENCTSLREVNFDATNCNYMGSNNNLVFKGCTQLNTLNIGEQVQIIPSYAFYQCGFSGNLLIPNSVTSIGGFAFYECREFSGGLMIPDSVTRIGSKAFYGCSGLSSLIIGKSVTTIGYNAFKGCNNVVTLCYNPISCSSCDDAFDWPFITDLNIGETVETIPSYAFNGCSGLTDLTIPNSVKSIGYFAFNGYNGTSVLIPHSVTAIGGSAFGNCPRLTTIYYNAENATGSSVFPNCPNLTTIHIGADVDEIHPVFSGCSSVHLVVALGPTPAVLESNALTDIAANSILMVSCGKKLTYFSVWNMFEFNNIMEDCGEYSISMSGIGTGGNVTSSATNAQMGQEVQLTVTPNAGMMLSSISVCNATDPTQNIPVYPISKANSTYGFIMPPFGVSVNASFVAGTTVSENNAVPASVYPNPTNGQINIEAEDLKRIRINNILGQTIFDSNANGNEFIYDFSKHNAGVYLIHIETANGVTVKKISVTQ